MHWVSLGFAHVQRRVGRMGYVVEQDRGPNIFPAFSLYPPHGFQLPHALQIYCPAASSASVMAFDSSLLLHV